MKAKRFVFMFLVLILVFAAQGLFAQNYPEKKNFAGETQAHQFRPHSGDKAEISHFFDFFVRNYRNPEVIYPLLAENSLTSNEVELYYKKILQYRSLNLVSADIEKLYSVLQADAFNNFRAIARFKFVGTDNYGRLIEHTDYLGLAKTGRGANDWKAWGVVWRDSGIDVSPAELVQFQMPNSGEEICVMETDAGVIKLRLFPDQVPKTVHNFKVLAKLGFYNNMPFLRVFDNFMIQCGSLDMTPIFELSSFGPMFEDEFSRDLYNFRGALCMGNAGPNTNGNQIYIVQSPEIDPEYLDLSALPLNVEDKYREVGGRAYLDNRYTVFGQVFEGIEAVDTIARQEADEEGRPNDNPIAIRSVKFETYY